LSTTEYDWSTVAWDVLVAEVREGDDTDALTELCHRTGVPLTDDLAEQLRRAQPRDKNGRWTSGGGGGKSAKSGGVRPGHVALEGGGEAKIIGKGDLSNPDTPRTRGVSKEEFAALASEGRTKLEGFRRDGSAPKGLDDNFDKISDDAYKSVQSEWGGATIDAHTGKALAGNADAYALTVKPVGVDSVSVPIGASREEFGAGMREARSRFDSELHAQQHHLGVFRDEDSGRVDIDPVLVVKNHHDVETIGSYTHAVGGAYHFASGDGYWPPYVKE
jgi:hypothetical protein